MLDAWWRVEAVPGISAVAAPGSTAAIAAAFVSPFQRPSPGQIAAASSSGAQWLGSEPVTPRMAAAVPGAYVVDGAAVAAGRALAAYAAVAGAADAADADGEAGAAEVAGAAVASDAAGPPGASDVRMRDGSAAQAGWAKRPFVPPPAAQNKIPAKARPQAPPGRGSSPRRGMGSQAVIGRGASTHQDSDRKNLEIGAPGNI